MAQECWPKRLREVADPLGRELWQAASSWLALRTKDGDEFVARDDIHVYGPFPSMLMLEAMLTNEAMAIGPREQEQITLDRADANVFAHYLLNANFIVARKSVPERDDEKWQN